jgi:hypothetical protein
LHIGKKKSHLRAWTPTQIYFSPFLQVNGLLVSLNLAENDLRVEGAKHVAEVLPKW